MLQTLDQMNKELSKTVSDSMISIGNTLNATLIAIQEVCPESEYLQYRDAIARILGEILLEILNPIYQEHPELKPNNLL